MSCLPRRSACSSALLKDADDLDESLDNVDRQVQDGQVRHTFPQRDKPKRDIDKLHAAANRLVFPAQPLRGRLGFNVPLSKPKVQFQSLLQPSLTTRRQHVDHAPRRMTTCNQKRALLHRHLQKLPELMWTFGCHSESQNLSFGREDTVQELTESSIKKFDEMVYQLERAAVAEETRAAARYTTFGSLIVFWPTVSLCFSF